MRPETTARMLEVLRPKPVADATVDNHVRSLLSRICAHPEAVQAVVEHACVTLRGIVSTEERARVVRRVAELRGVDSVIDLLREGRSDAAPARRQPPRIPRWQLVRARGSSSS